MGTTDLHLERWSPEETCPEGGWWAVCERCDDDAGPYPPVALFRLRKDAVAYIDGSDPHGDDLVFDACVTPAAVLADGTVALGNDIRINTHAELSAALEAKNG